jgi:hypothetical protein
MYSFLAAAAAILALLSTASLLAPDEGIRGIGRVLGGLSFVLVASFIYDLQLALAAPDWAKLVCVGAAVGSSVPPWISTICSGGDLIPMWITVSFLAAGIVTIGCGVHKYLRRNHGTTDTKN